VPIEEEEELVRKMAYQAVKSFGNEHLMNADEDGLSTGVLISP
jgi:hypothetical protein